MKKPTLERTVNVYESFKINLYSLRFPEKLKQIGSEFVRTFFFSPFGAVAFYFQAEKNIFFFLFSVSTCGGAHFGSRFRIFVLFTTYFSVIIIFIYFLVLFLCSLLYFSKLLNCCVGVSNLL